MAIALMVNTLVEINVGEIIWFSLETSEHRWRIIRPIRLRGHILCVAPGQFPVGFLVKPGQCRISARCRALLLGEVFGIVGFRAVVSRCRFIHCHAVASILFTLWPAVRRRAAVAEALVRTPNYSSLYPAALGCSAAAPEVPSRRFSVSRCRCPYPASNGVAGWFAGRVRR